VTRKEIRAAASDYSAALRSWERTPSAPSVLDEQGEFPQGHTRWRSATADLAKAAADLGRALGKHGCDVHDAMSLANDLHNDFPDATRQDYKRRMRKVHLRTERIADAVAAAMVTKRPPDHRVEARLSVLKRLQDNDADATEPILLERMQATGFPTLTLRTLQRDRAKLRARAAE
jgi:hypothetical protein